jgi:hypothetical protein
MRSITPGLLLWEIIHGTENSDNPLETENLVMKTKSTKISDGKTMTDYFKSTKSSTLSREKTSLPAISSTKDSIVLAFHGTRKHFSTDNVEEIRISYIPSKIQPYTPLKFDLTTYPIPPVSPSKHPTIQSPSRHSPSENSKSDSETDENEDNEVVRRREAKWSPDEVVRIWVPRVYIEHAFPKRFAEWSQREIVRKTPKKQTKKIVDKQVGAMDQFVRRPLNLDKGRQMRDTVEKSPVKTVSTRKENVKSPSSKIGKTIKSTSTKHIKSTPTKKISNIFKLTSTKDTKTIHSAMIKHIDTSMDVGVITEKWKLSDSDSDSDSGSLPSPTNILTYFPTPKIARDIELEEISPVGTNDETFMPPHVQTKMDEVLPVKGMGTMLVKDKSEKGGGKVLGGFRESLGGTLHEVGE